MLVSNHIKNFNLKRVSLAQATTTLGILIDKQRLIQGKSTQNIAQQIMHNLNPEQVEIIKESIKSLKISMLSDDV
jgi:hypothetical protein